MILINGKIWTGDNHLPWTEAVAIEGNRIVAAGSNGDMPHDPDGTIDLRGRLAVPGFIDNHTHFVDGGLQRSRVQLRDAATPREFARRIAEHAEKAGPGNWITGGAWDHTLWNPPALPSRQLIDPIAPENPVFVSRLDGHMGVANSMAMRLAGIDRETPDPPGGTIVRDAGGEPTGVLKDAAQIMIERAIPSPALRERAEAARRGLAEAARFGVTAFCDMSGAEAFEDCRAYELLDQNGELTARVHLFAPILGPIANGSRGDRLSFFGRKGFADGSLGSSTAAFAEPYSDDPHNRGLLMPAMTTGAMRDAIAAALRHDLQVAVHAIGDRAVGELLEIYESIRDGRERRLRIEHAQHLDQNLVRRFAAAGIIASMQPCHAVDDGRWAESKIGMKRSRWAYAFRSLIDAGVTVTFGSDWTVAPLDPIRGIHAAVTRRTTDGKYPNGWIPEEKISVEEALRCYTVNNAWAMFRENDIGAIAPGRLADIAVLSDDLFTIPLEEIENVKVEMTIFDGRVVYRGQPTMTSSSSRISLME